MTDALAINLDAPCWLWTKAKQKKLGYGILTRNGKHWLAHRYMWTIMRGPIPAGLTIDHLCRVRHCVNPQHLEVVTMRENNRRGNSPSGIHGRTTHCPRGHEYTEANTRRDTAGRHCRACSQAWNRARSIHE